MRYQRDTLKRMTVRRCRSAGDETSSAGLERASGPIGPQRRSTHAGVAGNPPEVLRSRSHLDREDMPCCALSDPHLLAHLQRRGSLSGVRTWPRKPFPLLRGTCTSSANPRSSGSDLTASHAGKIGASLAVLRQRSRTNITLPSWDRQRTAGNKRAVVLASEGVPPLTRQMERWSPRPH